MAVETLAGFQKAWASDQTPIWLPFRLAGKDRRIPADWSITSDGLAARLAERLSASAVILMKSCRVSAGAAIDRLVRDEIVDPEFARIVARARLEWLVLGPGGEGELARLIGVPAPADKARRS